MAAELCLKTLTYFKSNCTEFINPFDGSGHGVEKYAWTASQFIELFIGVIFCISYNASKKEITISPKLPVEFKNCRLAIAGLRISADVNLDMVIDNRKISYTVSNYGVKVLC